MSIIRFLPLMKALSMLSSLAFLKAARSLLRSLANSADIFLSMKTVRKCGPFKSSLFFVHTKSASISETNRTRIGRERATSLDDSFAAGFGLCTVYRVTLYFWAHTEFR